LLRLVSEAKGIEEIEDIEDIEEKAVKIVFERGFKTSGQT